MSFLKAEWRRLALANYEIDPQLLLPYLPHKTELDTWNGTHYVSLVGFMFKNTRMLGLKIPFHVNFEEVNLRFYVKYKEENEWRRGVVFVKEIVPRAAITFVANHLYREHYQTMKMQHAWMETEQSLITKYDWRYQGHWHSFSIDSEKTAVDIAAGSEAEFITEHYWGYTRIKEHLTFEYQVTHPRWQCYPVKDFQVNVDFGKIYGAEFSILNRLSPKSVMLAEGSSITVENKRRL